MKIHVLLILPLALCATMGHAQLLDTVSLGEVTVTAVKQGNDKVAASPSSTLLERAQLEVAGASSIKTAAPMVPNLFIPDYGSRMTSAIYLRGMGTRMDQPAVGLTIDNMPVMSKENYDIDLMDISRMEVLRGPQSAMYGRNTMAGVINIYTLSPLSYQGTRVLLEGASHGTWRAGLSHYHRFSPTLGLSASASMLGTEGEFRNEYNGRRTDWERQGSARVKLVWAPTAGTQLSNTLSTSVSRQGGYPYEYVETGVISYNDTCFYRRTSVSDALTLSTTFDGIRLDAFASYQYLDDNMTLDQDFTPQPYFTLTQASTEHAATADVIARCKEPIGSYSWTTGLTAFYRHTEIDAPVTLYDTAITELIENNINRYSPNYPVEWNERSFMLGSTFTLPTWGIALYHSSQYTAGNVDLKGSLRLDYEHAALSYRSTTHTGYSIMHDGIVFAQQSIDVDDTGELSKHYLQLLPSLTATWHIDDRNTLHFTASRGSKAGGYNTQMFSDMLQQRLMSMMGMGETYDVDDVVGYKPETAWNIELGTHLSTADHRLTANLNAFATWCRDLQLTVFPDGNTTGRMMTNAGKSRNLGVEAAVTWHPRESTGLDVAYGFTHAEFLEYNDGTADYKGKHVPYVPSHTLHASAYNRWAVHGCGDWLSAIMLSVRVQGAGRIYWNEENSVSQPFYAVLGSELTLEGRHYSLELWGRNLTDTDYRTFYFVSMSREFLQRAHGRSLGATLRLRF